eukprot:5074269-Lingulodinium_polyedra.AAC.1
MQRANSAMTSGPKPRATNMRATSVSMEAVLNVHSRITASKVPPAFRVRLARARARPARGLSLIHI